MPDPSSSPGSRAVAGMRSPRRRRRHGDANGGNPVLVIGLGEIGGPLLENLAAGTPGSGPGHRGSSLRRRPGPSSLLPVHLRFRLVCRLATSRSYEPEVVVVNSTVVPGTTRQIQEKTGVPVVYSPVRGKHTRMTDELRHFRKFVAGASAQAVTLVEGPLRRRRRNYATHVLPEALRTRKASWRPPTSGSWSRGHRRWTASPRLSTQITGKRSISFTRSTISRRSTSSPASSAGTASCRTSNCSSRCGVPSSSTS